MSKAIILLSGGLDSTTVLAIAKEQGYECYALSFDYGQKQRSELESSKKIANKFEVSEHRIMKISLNDIGGSALTDNNISMKSPLLMCLLEILYFYHLRWLGLK